jgi:tetratricopeptide (TPR) repeat protein
MQATETKYSWYDIPEDVKHLLVLASENWGDNERSQQYMNDALAKAEDNIDVLVGAYRYFFYKNNPTMALSIAQKVMNKIKKEENLPDNWEELKPILVKGKNESETLRMYINAYASTGFVLAKLGKLDEAKEVTEKVKEIDDKRESCATTVFEVLTAPPEEDE